ncbi:hypothetical protein P9112_001132 [Eukaryota sp. TZLM1-RC]
MLIYRFRIKLNFKNKENENENTFGKRRADLITPASDGVIKVVDVVTVDVCKDSAIDFAKRDETPLCFAEKSKFFSSLLEVNESLIRSHVFCSSILCKAAFLGGGKNFVFDFFQRFPFDVHLINGESNFYLNQLQFELENLPSDIWIQCFPQNVQEIPTRSLPNLRFCLKSFSTIWLNYIKAWIMK